MANDSQANARRKRLAAKKLYDRAVRAAKQEENPTDVAYGMPSELGSGKYFGSAKNIHKEEEHKEENGKASE